ncbi:MAG: BrxE family protein [Phycisphaerales bacterium]|nr:BrxE family protein [Phycisphaerales bacterium]
MTQELITTIVQLRAAVGFLGEQGPKARWPSAFFSASSRSFLSPLFPRTLALSQLRGVIAAAARVHDERIGVGDVYHLFRLPEESEQAAHHFMLSSQAAAAVAASAADATCASTTLTNFAATQKVETPGPARIASAEQIDDLTTWQRVAGHYSFGFRNDTEAFPFFSAK